MLQVWDRYQVCQRRVRLLERQANDYASLRKSRVASRSLET